MRRRGGSTVSAAAAIYDREAAPQIGPGASDGSRRRRSKLESSSCLPRSGGLAGGGLQEQATSICRSREGSGKGAGKSGAEEPHLGKRRRSTDVVEASSDESSTAGSWCEAASRKAGCEADATWSLSLFHSLASRPRPPASPAISTARLLPPETGRPAIAVLLDLDSVLHSCSAGCCS
ncbi:hypothetical protein GUJ93_ZPchr0006g45954 [Zizania palustris]|uniref:Uncharacterized protein n=1 Tax=Zizania palustris TaxID=103762 RepID=A0A8J5T1K3_ZIZPA|nr:hypothetical protein GUJ93_ZPchr0006g45954 [Zizania palustris]